MEKIMKYWYVWGALLLVGGFAIGKNWNTWFPVTPTIPPTTGPTPDGGRYADFCSIKGIDVGSPCPLLDQAGEKTGDGYYKSTPQGCVCEPLVNQ